MCPNNHDSDRIEARPDGTRVCGACREHYGSRRRRHGRAVRAHSTTSLPNHRLEGVTFDSTIRTSA